MSFGEHLDELRGALVRSVLGLAVAMCIAFPFADDLVLFVEQPLTRALGRLEHARAVANLQAVPDHHRRLADALMIQEGKLVPKRVLLDRSSLAELSSPSPSEAAEGKEPLEIKDPQGLLKIWIEAADRPSISFLKALFARLSPSDQAELRELGNVPTWSDAATGQLREVLAHLCAGDRLDSDAALKALDKELSPSLRAFLDAPREAGTTPDPRHVQDVNRVLLHAAFPAHIPLPAPQWVEITIWETASARLQSLNAPEPFLIWMKALMVLGIVIASPYIFLQIWNFVAAGLYRHERNLVHMLLPASLILFFAGASLAFFFVFDPVLDFLFGFNLKMNIEMQPRVSDWMSFVLLLPLGFGVSFQLPLVMLALERMGIVSVETYLSKWRIAVMVIFVLSSVLTPADPLSMIFMAVPLTFLYFGGIWFCHASKKRASPVGVGYDP